MMLRTVGGFRWRLVPNRIAHAFPRHCSELGQLPRGLSILLVDLKKHGDP